MIVDSLGDLTMAIYDDAPFEIVAADVDRMILAGQLANEKAAGDVFADHMRHKAEETKKGHEAQLADNLR